MKIGNNPIHKLHLILFCLQKYIHGKLVIDNSFSYKGSMIYSVNHTNVSDIPVVFHTLNRQAYILAGTKLQKLIDSIGFNLNGVVWVDRQSATSIKKSTDKIYKILSSGGSVM